MPEEPLARHCKRSFSKGLVASFIFSFTCFLWVFKNVNIIGLAKFIKFIKNPTLANGCHFFGFLRPTCSRFQHFDNSNFDFKELIIGLLDSRATLNLIHCKFVFIQSMLLHVNSKKETKVTRFHVMIIRLCSSKNKNGFP